MLGLSDAQISEEKSLQRAYLYCLCLGAFGAHRFYLGYGTSAATQLVVTLIGLLSLATGAGAAFLSLIGLWLVYDLAVMPTMIRRVNHRDAPIMACAATRANNRAWH
ncbi:NINE protein [Albirhodobacter sp. R86504]|jgi:TM2 domain-containing membrane protein YozV|uniref:NINE protein n=1 Tax=Albirhodobacter sp. R86504 TaxID=3093848 RepID=UPI0036734B0F